MKIKRVDPTRQKSYTGTNKEFFESNDISSLPSEVREAMHPLKEHIRKVALDTIADAIKFVEEHRNQDHAIVLMRLQKLHRLLSHLEGKSDADIHSIGTSAGHSKGKSMGSSVKVGGMGDRGTTIKDEARKNLLDRLEYGKHSANKVLRPGTPSRRKV